jgi:hypothetical protein
MTQQFSFVPVQLLQNLPLEMTYHNLTNGLHLQVVHGNLMVSSPSLPSVTHKFISICFINLDHQIFPNLLPYVWLASSVLIHSPQTHNCLGILKVTYA